MGGIIRQVLEGSVAAELGIQPGDEIVAVDGQALGDLIDYRYVTAEERFELSVRGASGERQIGIEWDPGDDLGIEFESPVFGAVRECNNRCAFCFVDQAPPGMRASTLIHDDDYRLSFLCGNFVTLTNLSESDLRRIEVMRLSPLHVSVHATEPEVRARLFRSPNHERGLSALRRLADAGIQFHCQIVVCPGINDGEHLGRTVRDLAEMDGAVLSVGVVPVGLTPHREGLVPLRPVTAEDARAILGQLDPMQGGYMRRAGTRFVFAADEIYLAAGVPFPPDEAYEDYPQIENGVGLCRPFFDTLDGELRRMPSAPGRQCTLVTGTSAGPLLEQVFRATLGSESACRVLAVRNRFFGDSVTVAGLLAGRDVADALASAGIAERPVILPGVALSDGELFIDSYPLSQLRSLVGAPVVVAENATDIVRAIA